MPRNNRPDQSTSSGSSLSSSKIRNSKRKRDRGEKLVRLRNTDRIASKKKGRRCVKNAACGHAVGVSKRLKRFWETGRRRGRRGWHSSAVMKSEIPSSTRSAKSKEGHGTKIRKNILWGGLSARGNAAELERRSPLWHYGTEERKGETLAKSDSSGTLETEDSANHTGSIQGILKFYIRG